LNQTILDIEVLAVNDGSTDNSKTILDQLAAEDQRLQVFHNGNKGVSAARNFGLQRARGAYIGFSDADDFMDPTMLEELYQAMIEGKADWAICNVRLMQEGKEPKTRLNMTDQVLEAGTGKAAFVHGLMRFHYDNANWNKLFKASIIREQQLCFAEDMRIWEDLLFNLQYLQSVNRVAVVAKPLYNYRILGTALFSGETTDLLPQFNKLYDHYLQFAQEINALEEAEAFKLEMARITYNQLLWKAEVKVRSGQNIFFTVLKSYIRELKRFNPAVFYYPGSERKGLQGIKRQLLQRRQFGLFALIIAVKPFLRKPYHLLRRLLKK
jgi:glycosyltransferase involved in cell wall biosynthesis